MAHSKAGVTKHSSSLWEKKNAGYVKTQAGSFLQTKHEGAATGKPGLPNLGEFVATCRVDSEIGEKKRGRGGRRG